jgi:hypothetical protein
VDVDRSLARSATEERGHLGRLAQVFVACATLIIAQDDVSTGDVSRMEPQVFRARKAECETVVLLCPAPDVEAQATRRQVVAPARLRPVLARNR